MELPKDNSQIKVQINMCLETKHNLDSLFNKVLTRISIDNEHDWSSELHTLRGLINEIEEELKES
jgi:hypothetical protein